MNTKLLRLSRSREPFRDTDIAQLKEAGEILRSGGLVAFPTETVYGLGGDALNPDSSRKIYAAKGRPSDNPLIIHIADMHSLEEITSSVPEEARLLAEHFWPGPLTMVLPKAEGVPKETTGGLDTVAVRMPSDPIAAKMIEFAGGFVAAPSANRSGKPSPTVAKYVMEDMNGRIDAVIDGGAEAIGLESTIVDLTSSPAQILRPGFITAAMLSEVLGYEIQTDRAILEPGSNIAPKAPGMKYRHYAPNGEMTLVSGESAAVTEYIKKALAEAANKGLKTGVLTVEERMDDFDADVIFDLGKEGDLEAAARNLYTYLREFDEHEVDCIYSECFRAEGFGAALMNRLCKAAGYNIIKV